MKRILLILLAAALLVVACSPAASDPQSGQATDGQQVDDTVIVYRAPT